MGEAAWIEALTRKKPRRIVHHQLLIQTCLMLTFIVPFPIAGMGFWLVFDVYPIVAVPAVLIAWLVLFVSYTALKVHNVRQTG